MLNRPGFSLNRKTALLKWELEAPNSSLASNRWQSWRRNMRRSLFGVVLGTLLVFGLTAGEGLTEPPPVVQSPIASSPSIGQPSSQPTSNLITHVLPAEGGAPAVVVVDPGQRVLAVYHIDKTTGEIALRSVRNITWDLQMVEFNSGEPLPQDIRKMSGELQR
jgi:hypothetical protein